MNETDTTVVSSEVDVDDVEAHGIREVMVGLSAAAVLTGGVAAVVSANDGPGSSDRATISADAQAGDVADANLAASSSDASRLGTSAAAGRAATGAAGVATEVLSSSSTRATGAVVDAPDDADDVSAPTFLGRSVEHADALVDGGVSWTREVRDDALDATRSTLQNTREVVADARTTVRNAPSNVLGTTQRVSSAAIGQVPTVSDVVAAADRTVDATFEIVGGSVRGLEGTASTLVARIQPEAGVNLDTRTASGWVTLSVGGQEIARAQLTEGQATLSYTAPSADVPITVSFTGSDLVRVPSITL